MNDRKEPLPDLIIVGPLPPPSIGPAIATRGMLQSALFKQRFEILHLDISDREGHKDIGRWSIRNVLLALRHGFEALSLVWKRPRSVLYLSIARGKLGLARDSLLVLPCLLLGVPYVLHFRCGEFTVYTSGGRFRRFWLRQIFGRACRALYLGENLKSITGDLFLPERQEVVHNGINLEFYHLRPLPERIDKVKFCSIANLYRDKGTHVVLEAVLLLRERTEKFHVTFAGWWHDEQFRRECEEFVRANRLEDLVTFHEPVMLEAKRDLLYAHDAVIFCPVEQEGMPWTVLEGMAASMPVVATPQGTIPELVRDGENGRLISPGDAEALARAMDDLIHDPDGMLSMGNLSRALIESKYNEANSLGILAEILESAYRKRFGAISTREIKRS